MNINKRKISNAIAAGKNASKKIAKAAKTGAATARGAATTGAKRATAGAKAAAKRIDKKKTSQFLKKVLIMKAGSATSTAGVFGLASVFGTAGTGTAIGTLSGAAANSATLAWLGGSVATGSIVIIGVGIAGGLAAKYISDKIAEGALHDMLLDAIRRSDSELADATPAQIAEHFQHYTPEQMQGVINNVKGIFHEMWYARKENTDGDGITADLPDSTTYKGGDIEITNIATGAVEMVQLKATDSLAYIQEHLVKYPDIKILVTDEIAQRFDSLESSGFFNEELKEIVGNFFGKLIY